ncbi:MAG TPA: trypsin-like peptidase domain-containing protein [Solirubrobacteraceae bacterium]|nr:trypsin-like peptidase domain-containing protein [Solirubrobacteraceae bacterium]
MRGLFGTALAAAVGGGITAAVLLWTGAAGDDRGVTVVESAGTAPLSRPGEPSAADVYARDAAGVVFVRAARLQEQDGPFAVAGESATEAAGSGFLIDEDGLVLTTAHVVSKATELTVAIDEDVVVPARVVGTDPDTDLALLRVDLPDDVDVHPLELGDSSSVRVGDAAMAIGNPYGLERTLTTGVVSALRQRITAPSGFGITGVIQTDASVSARSAGGPLLDASGSVIGINSQISADGEVVDFAVPVDTAKQVVPLLQRDGRVRRAYLGIAGGLAADGIQVEQVQPGSPAEKAGVRVGQAITRLDGRVVRSMEDIVEVLARRAPGDEVELEIRSGATQRTVVVTLADRPATAPAK